MLLRPDHRFWLTIAAAGSATLVVATFARTLLDAESSPWALALLDLRIENNLAVWWSAMLLLMVALHAFDGVARERSFEPRRARGWLLLALIALVFSADELASVHERVGILGDLVGVGRWLARAPFGLVLLAMLVVALVAFRASRLEPRRLALIGSGFLLYLTVPLQEYLEHRVPWSDPLALALRAAVEEGTELGATLLLLCAVLSNTGIGGTPAGAPTFAAVWRLRAALTLATLILTPVLAAFTVSLTDTFRGLPANWPSAVMLLLTALALATRGPEQDRLWRYAAGALALIASAAAVQLDIGSRSEIGVLAVNRRFLVLLASALLVAAVACRRSDRSGAVVAALALAIAAGGCLLHPGDFALYVAFGVAATALYWVSSRPLARRSGEGTSPTMSRQRSSMIPGSGGAAQ